MLYSMLTHNLVLRPNCLLTRYPLVFITGPRSLFWSKRLASDLQDYIEAHGYQVLCPVLPFRGPTRSKSLQNWFKRQPNHKFHIFLSSTSAQEFKEVLAGIHSVSVTLTDSFIDSSSLKPTTPFSYQLHTLFSKLNRTDSDPFHHTLNWSDPSLYDRFLDHCVELAENEVLCET